MTLSPQRNQTLLFPATLCATAATVAAVALIAHLTHLEAKIVYDAVGTWLPFLVGPLVGSLFQLALGGKRESFNFFKLGVATAATYNNGASWLFFLMVCHPSLSAHSAPLWAWLLCLLIGWPIISVSFVCGLFCSKQLCGQVFPTGIFGDS